MLHGNGDVECVGQEETTIGHSQNRTHYNQPINTRILFRDYQHQVKENGRSYCFDSG